MAKKDFKAVSMSFISPTRIIPEETTEKPSVSSLQASEAIERQNINPASESPHSAPQRPQRPTPETKSQRVQLLIKPSTIHALREMAAENGTSVNNLINMILEDATRK